MHRSKQSAGVSPAHARNTTRRRASTFFDRWAISSCSSTWGERKPETGREEMGVHAALDIRPPSVRANLTPVRVRLEKAG